MSKSWPLAVSSRADSHRDGFLNAFLLFMRETCMRFRKNIDKKTCPRRLLLTGVNSVSQAADKAPVWVLGKWGRGRRGRNLCRPRTVSIQQQDCLLSVRLFPSHILYLTVPMMFYNYSHNYRRSQCVLIWHPMGTWGNVCDMKWLPQRACWSEPCCPTADGSQERANAGVETRGRAIARVAGAQASAVSPLFLPRLRSGITNIQIQHMWVCICVF